MNLGERAQERGHTVEQAARRRDQEVDSLAQLLRLSSAVRASDYNSVWR